MEGVPTIMETFTAGVANFWSLVNSSWTAITGNPVWIIPLTVPLVGSGVAMAKRLVKPGNGRRGR